MQGATPRYTEYPGRDHGMDKVYCSAELYDWLLRQHAREGACSKISASLERPYLRRGGTSRWPPTNRRRARGRRGTNRCCNWPTPWSRRELPAKNGPGGRQDTRFALRIGMGRS